MRNFLFRFFPGIYENFNSALVINDDNRLNARRSLLMANMMGTLIANLTTGLFFTGLLIAINAPDEYIGYVNVAITLCGFTQLFSALVLERMRTRKKLLIGSRVIYHLINSIGLSIVAFAKIDQLTKLVLFMVCIVLINVLSSIAGPGFGVWHIGYAIPEPKRASYYSVFHILNGIISVLAMVTASFSLDLFKAGGNEIIGIIILRSISMLIGAFELYLFSKIPEPEYEFSAQKLNLTKLLTTPLKNPRYLMSVAICWIWTFSVSFSGMYFTTYLLESAKMSYTFISVVGIVSIPCLIIAMPIWTRIVSKIGWLKALTFSTLIYSLGYILNVFVTEQLTISYVLAIIVLNLAAPGINLVFSNLPYMNIPKENQTIYIGFYSTIGGSLASVLGAYLGTLFIKYTADVTFTLFSITFVNKQYINLIQFVGILLLSLTAYREHKRNLTKQN